MGKWGAGEEKRKENGERGCLELGKGRGKRKREMGEGRGWKRGGRYCGKRSMVLR